MIISASYKTDIPTFYGKWFMNRLRAGFCKMVNPYGRQVYRVSLKPEDVDGFVFWTKNAGPFLAHLSDVRAMGFPFVVQYTINGYPRALETSVIDARKTIEHARKIAGDFGSRVLVWRYDTIVVTSVTPPDWHLENFRRLADSLRGATDEVVVSFMQDYMKTRRNLDESARAVGFSWRDPEAAEKRHLANALVAIASEHGMRLTVCSQREFVVPGAGASRCVDARRMEDVSGVSIQAKLKGNRTDCGCFESRDIGDYDTCPHGCVYCYAVQNRSLALTRYKAHDPDSEFLFAPDGALQGATINGEMSASRGKRQLRLFGKD